MSTEPSEHIGADLVQKIVDTKVGAPVTDFDRDLGGDRREYERLLREEASFVLKKFPKPSQ